MWSFAILGFFILGIIFILVHETRKGYKTESWKKPYSPAKTKQYIREKIKIENKHCANLPGLDSRGIYGGVAGSFTDRTGKFSDAYQQDIDELNKRFGIGFDDV
jgi:hypothetical protein